MCRSIKVLRRPGQSTTEEELHSAALQFVRKISGFPKPSKASQEAFDQAVRDITAASDRLLRTIGVSLHSSTNGSGPKQEPGVSETL